MGKLVFISSEYNNKKKQKKVKFISMHNRERPLQSSMFLPDHNSRRQTYEYTMQPNVLKKSSTFNNSEQLHHQPYFLSPQHITTSTPRPIPHDDSRENRGLPRSVDLMLGEIGEKVDKLTKIVDKHEYQINNQTINKADEITKIVLNQVRQNLPNFTTNSDVYQHIFNIKLDIKGLQEEVQRCIKENQFKKLETNLKDSMSENNKKLEKSLQNSQKAPQQEGISGQLLKKRDDYFQKMINNLETQISFLKKSLQNHSLDLKISPISSSSIIMLKYQQVFRARNKTQTDMVINQHTYYIDNEGYLLDSHSRYIVDQKGKKVRLEEKHITMLRNQQILQ